jgi:hypothetical protein
MGDIEKSPSTEAMQAIVDRINSGDSYELDGPVEYTERIIDELEDISDLRIDVVTESESQLEETLDVEDRTQIIIRVFIRSKVDSLENDTIDPLKLLVRKLWRRLNNFDSADGRVKVWDCDVSPKEVPIKSILQNHRLFVATLLLRIEVEPS